jgi:hypothetical protein
MGPLLRIARLYRCAKRAARSSYISIDWEKTVAIRNYPASSVNREMIHQMNRKHIRHVDPSKVMDVSRPPVAAAGNRNPVARNHPWRARQS